MTLPAVFVTGGNAGIGAAICKQLVLDQECKVFMGSRSTERGQVAVKDMRLGDKEANIFVVQCDVQADDSVRYAASKVDKCNVFMHFDLSCYFRFKKHWVISIYMVW